MGREWEPGSFLGPAPSCSGNPGLTEVEAGFHCLGASHPQGHSPGSGYSRFYLTSHKTTGKINTPSPLDLTSWTKILSGE